MDILTNIEILNSSMDVVQYRVDKRREISYEYARGMIQGILDTAMSMWLNDSITEAELDELRARGTKFAGQLYRKQYKYVQDAYVPEFNGDIRID